MPSINVTISGKNYRMACDPGQEEHLLGLAAELDGTIEDLRGSFGEIGDQRLTVMAAITMADSRAEARRRIRDLEAELANLRKSATVEAKRMDASENELSRVLVNASDRIAAAAVKVNTDPPGT